MVFGGNAWYFGVMHGILGDAWYFGVMHGTLGVMHGIFFFFFFFAISTGHRRVYSRTDCRCCAGVYIHVVSQ